MEKYLLSRLTLHQFPKKSEDVICNDYTKIRKMHACMEYLKTRGEAYYPQIWTALYGTDWLNNEDVCDFIFLDRWKETLEKALDRYSARTLLTSVFGPVVPQTPFFKAKDIRSVNYYNSVKYEDPLQQIGWFSEHYAYWACKTEAGVWRCNFSNMLGKAGKEYSNFALMALALSGNVAVFYWILKKLSSDKDGKPRSGGTPPPPPNQMIDTVRRGVPRSSREVTQINDAYNPVVDKKALYRIYVRDFMMRASESDLKSMNDALTEMIKMYRMFNDSSWVDKPIQYNLRRYGDWGSTVSLDNSNSSFARYKTTNRTVGDYSYSLNLPSVSWSTTVEAVVAAAAITMIVYTLPVSLPALTLLAPVGARLLVR